MKNNNGILTDIQSSLASEKSYPYLDQQIDTLRSILNSLADGVAVVNKEGKFLYSNQVAERIMGLGPKNVAPEEWASIYGCYYPDKVTPYDPGQLPLVRAMKGEEITDEIIFIKNPQRPKGIFISVSASPLRDKKGEVSGGTIIFQDITEKIQTAIMLKQSEERGKALFKELPVPTYTWTKTKDDFILTDYNIAAEDITKGTVSKAKGAKLSEVHSERPDFIEAILKVYNEKIHFEHEIEQTFRYTGEHKHLNVKYRFVPPDMVLVHTEDITERKIAILELSRSEASLSEAQRIARLGNWELDILSNKLTWSDEIYRMLGLSPQEFEATHEAFMERVHPDDRNHVQESVNQALLGEADYRIDHRIVLPDGTVRIVHETGELKLNKDGSPERLIGTIQDLTELKITNEKLEESLDRAEFFVDIMGHDLSNINQATYGLLDLLLYSESLEPDQEDILQEVLQQISRSSSLIKDVRTFKKIEDNPPELVSVDPIESLKSAINLVEKEYPDKTLNIVGKLKAKQFQVIANEHLVSVFYALLHNSMQFDKAQEVVIEFDIRKNKEKSLIEIEISDHGPGIPDTAKESLFDRISHKKKGYLGRGMGLTLLKQIMGHFGGNVSVQDRVKGKHSHGVKFKLAFDIAN